MTFNEKLQNSKNNIKEYKNLKIQYSEIEKFTILIQGNKGIYKLHITVLDFRCSQLDIEVAIRETIDNFIFDVKEGNVEKYRIIEIKNN